MQEKALTSMHSVGLEPAKLILTGTRTNQATVLCNIHENGDTEQVTTPRTILPVRTVVQATLDQVTLRYQAATRWY